MGAIFLIVCLLWVRCECVRFDEDEDEDDEGEADDEDEEVDDKEEEEDERLRVTGLCFDLLRPCEGDGGVRSR